MGERAPGKAAAGGDGVEAAGSTASPPPLPPPSVPLPPDALDAPCGPPPEASRSRGAVCQAARLVHAALLDGAIGATPVRGA